jgi:hypothetical protein
MFALKGKANNINSGSLILKSWDRSSTPLVAEECSWNILEYGQEK